ncbi:MAG: RNA polymerase subunit sigma-70 [Streptosporangiaceae bacterium]
MGASPRAGEHALLELARSGDESAFGDLVGAYRAELHAHCYRLLGSVHDTEDAVQDAMLRAWRGLPGFEGRSSIRTWLYAIATTAALSLAQRRAHRELPAGFGPATEDRPPELTWLEPYPDQMLGEPLISSPEAHYEQRESLELAFVVALQLLPPRQRAVLILRDVVGFSARETASQLGTTVASVTSALQRARAATQARGPARSQQAALRTLGDEQVKALAERYADAIEQGDADRLISLLTSDATWSMPPTRTCLRGLAAIREFLVDDVASVRWRHLATRANGQLAVGCYIFSADRACYVASVLDVLTVCDGKIAAVNAFITADSLREMGETGYDDGGYFSLADFTRFGLPLDLP